MKEEILKILTKFYLVLHTTGLLCQSKIQGVYSDWLTLKSVESSDVTQKDLSRITDLHSGSSLIDVAEFLLENPVLKDGKYELAASKVELLPLKLKLTLKQREPHFLIEYEYETSKRKSWITDATGLVIGNVDDFSIDIIESLPRIEFIFDSNTESLELGSSKNTLLRVALNFLNTKVDLKSLSRFVVKADGTITVLSEDGPNLIIPISEARQLSFYTKKATQILADLNKRGEIPTEIDFTYAKQVIVRGVQNQKIL